MSLIYFYIMHQFLSLQRMSLNHIRKTLWTWCTQLVGGVGSHGCSRLVWMLLSALMKNKVFYCSILRVFDLCCPCCSRKEETTLNSKKRCNKGPETAHICLVTSCFLFTMQPSKTFMPKPTQPQLTHFPVHVNQLSWVQRYEWVHVWSSTLK